MNYKEIVKIEMVPAFGCTEPIALAFDGGKGARGFGRDVLKNFLIACSGNMIKNAKSVIVPGE